MTRQEQETLLARAERFDAPDDARAVALVRALAEALRERTAERDRAVEAARAAVEPPPAPFPDPTPPDTADDREQAAYALERAREATTPAEALEWLGLAAAWEAREAEGAFLRFEDVPSERARLTVRIDEDGHCQAIAQPRGGVPYFTHGPVPSPAEACQYLMVMVDRIDSDASD